MSSILTKLKHVCEDMSQSEIPWALVGALAVGVHVEPRSTRDIDLAVVLLDKNQESDLIEELQKRGYSGLKVLMHSMPTHKMGIRLQVRGDSDFPVALDLLFSSSGIEPEITTAATKVEVFPGIYIPVASRGHLIAMKVLSKNDSDRIRDSIDLQLLLQTASHEDIVVAGDALILMTKRTSNRGKDLQVDFKVALQSYAPHLVAPK